MADGDRLLTAQEAADLLGLKLSTVRRLTYTRELPVVRPTGKRAVRYRKSELEALLRRRSQPARKEFKEFSDGRDPVAR
jgi:excisionase family DNA binding protein